MLNAARPGLIEEWEAYDRIEPFGDEQLTRLFLYAISAIGSGDPDWQTLRRRPAAEEMDDGPTMDETAAAISAAFGR